MSIKETEAELRRLTEALRASQLLEAASTQEVLNQKGRAENAERENRRLRDGITELIQRGEADYGINSSPVVRLRILLDGAQ